MNRQIEDFLIRQEERERQVYGSEEKLREMIKNDFLDSGSVFRLIGEKTGGREDGTVRLFRRASFITLQERWPIPVRKCSSFYISKHTMSQVPYFHDHDFYELICVMKGKCTQQFRQEGTGKCDAAARSEREAPLVLSAGEWCLIGPGTVHAVARCREEDMILKFMIPRDVFASAVRCGAEKHDDPAVFCGRGEHSGPVIFYSAGPQIDHLICMLMAESTGRRAYWEEAVRHYLGLLFIELMREPSVQIPEMAQSLEGYFEMHPETAALKEFAAEIGYSSAYAGKRIREQTGKNFSRNLLDWRMKKAARLLTDTDESVEAVAAALGYAGRSGLYKQFQERYGMTPGEYRELFREQKDMPVGKK